MNKNISILIISLLVLCAIFLIFVPYLTSDFLDLRQKKENEAIEQRILQEKIAKAQALQKIYLMGKFDQSTRDDFILIPAQYVLGGKMYLRKETYAAYLRMRSAAIKEGIELNIASATRNFDYQRELWNKKWTGVTLVEGKNLSKSIEGGEERFKKILEYSAVPGTSRHHWGTDIDINAATLEYFETPEGEKVYAWLAKNAASFGFCQTYDLKGSIRATGYNEEKWHWSYLPLSRAFTQEYKNLIKNEDIQGFNGDEFAADQDLINDYVLSINPDCL